LSRKACIEGQALTEVSGCGSGRRAIDQLVPLDELDDRAAASSHLRCTANDYLENLLEIGNGRKNFLLRGNDGRKAGGEL
ncbi:MAG: hypothetical protein ABIP63_05490, partial [Thermoanaerobaculia bacterium]